MSPDYGSQTICRPLKSNVPEGLPGWVLKTCPYCGRACWKTTAEPDPLPAGCAVACMNCALRRNRNQQSMDAARFARELNPERSPP